PLTTIAGETLGFRPKPLKRDAYGLYTNEEMKGLKILTFWTAFVLVILSTSIASSGNLGGGLALYYITAIVSCIVGLLAGTMYLDREGWIFLEDSQWGEKFQEKLGEQDHNLRTLTHWGSRLLKTLVPRWEAPGRRPWMASKLIDLHSRVYVETAVVSRPNALVPLAIHESGVTCMLLERPEATPRTPTRSLPVLPGK
ncbi:hypothetical protein FB451DRAFT_1026531, partial [Mycena latifolia]